MKKKVENMWKVCHKTIDKRISSTWLFFSYLAHKRRIKLLFGCNRTVNRAMSAAAVIQEHLIFLRHLIEGGAYFKTR